MPNECESRKHVRPSFPTQETPGMTFNRPPLGERPGAFAVPGTNISSDHQESLPARGLASSARIIEEEETVPVYNVSARLVDEEHERQCIRRDVEAQLREEERQRIRQALEGRLQGTLHEDMDTPETRPAVVTAAGSHNQESHEGSPRPYGSPKRLRQCAVFILKVLLAAAVVIVVVMMGERWGTNGEETSNPSIASTDRPSSKPSFPPATQAPITELPATTVAPISASQQPLWTWSQMGQDIDGAFIEDRFGSSVALSADGTIVAVGANQYSRSDRPPGYVRIFQYSDEENRWEQLGPQLSGKAQADMFGESVALSANGRILAVGASQFSKFGDPGYVLVFQFNEDRLQWTQMGQRIFGESEDDSFGYSVALSSNGTTLAVGAPFNDGNSVNAGHVRLFRHSGSTNQWVQLGKDLDGNAAVVGSSGGVFGESVSLSADGTIVACGGSLGDSIYLDSGIVRVFKYSDDANMWNQLGQDLDSREVGDFFGFSVALSANGMILAAGAHGNNINGLDSGQVRVFQYSDIDRLWFQLGQSLSGDEAWDYFGRSVAISYDGRIVATGADYTGTGGFRSGKVRVFWYDKEKNEWDQIGQDLIGEDASDRFGESISLSGDGRIIAAGSIWNDGNGDNAGHVRVYKSEGP